MQSKFTQQNLLSFCTRTVTLFLFLAALSQFTFAQDRPGAKNQTDESLRAHKASLLRGAVSEHSFGPAPVQSLRLNNTPSADAGSPFSSAFCYSGAGPFQLNKQSLLNTTLTPIGAPVPFVFPGAAAWVTTTQKMYVVDQGAPFALYTVDTLSGIRTFIANCTGVPQANLTGITWDISTNTMYGVSSSIAVSQIFTMNIATGVCTPIGAPTTVSPGAIQLNAAPGGSLFSVDIVNDNLHRWNKTTGVPTVIGPVGFNANFGQDGHFDISDGQYFWAAFNATANQAQLRIVDTLTGSSTLVGSYPAQVETLAIYPVPQFPCSGVPTPGNTIASPNPVCLNSNFTLSPQNPTLGSGVTYQWQTGPDGVNWTNIPGATNAALVRTQTAPAYYRVSVTCAGNTVFTTPLQVTTAPVTSCYCIPTYTTGCPLGDFIARVRLLTIDNTTGCSTPPFTYYSAIPPANLIAGGTYQLIVTVGPDTFGQNVAAWADWNVDGDFNDAGEFLATPINAGASGTATINFTVPVTAAIGDTRLRIRGGDDVAQSSTQSCGASNSGFGEAEDYNINVAPCIIGAFTAQPTNTSAQCSGTTTFTVGHSGSALSYIWEQRVNASAPWSVVTNGGPFSGATTNTLTISNAPSTMNGYQYRAVVSGPCTAPDFSGVATLTITPLIATVTPPSPITICSGQIQQISLTNVAAPVQLVNEGFNTVAPLPTGWASNNRSNPLGPFGWFQGVPAIFNSHSGPADSYIAANWQNTTTTGVGTISNWLFMPTLTMNNGNTLTFWTRKVAPDAFPDRLQVRLSTNGASVNVGTTETSVGDFTTVLLDINPTLITGVYPTDWTMYTITLSGLPGPTSGRIAFRYFVTQAGGAAPNSDFIGIDDVIFTAGSLAQGVWTSNPAAPNTMFTNAAATIPYVAGSPANSIWVNPTVTTTYTVVYTTTTPCVSAPTNIVVNVVNPVGAITAPTNKSACVGGSTSFTASAVGGPFTYQWQVSTDGGATYTNIAGATAATLNLTNVTQTMNNYRYRVVFNANACSSTATSAAATLTVNPLPTVTISASSLALTPGVSTTITATSTPGPLTPTSFTWFFNGTQMVTTPASNTNTITANIDQLGSYQARVVDANGCVNVSNVLVVGAASSERLWIYPNPTDGQFQVRVFFDGPSADFREVRVYNEQGQLVARKAFDLFVGQPPYLQMDFDLRHLSSGTYVVKVEEKFTGKIKSGLLVIQ